MGTKKPQIELVPLEKLRPNPNNPRVNDHAVDAVAKSIQAFGFQNPIITDGRYKVCAGHTRLKAAEKLGMTTVPVIRVPGLRGSKFTGYSIADNKTGEIADWHEDLLRKMVWELKADDNFTDMGALGFADRELTAMLRDPDDSKADAVPDPPKTLITKPGDLWVLGQHRLLCGDATKGEDVSWIMGDAKVDATITDPPYGVSYDRSQEQRGGKRDAHVPYQEGESTAVLRFLGVVPSDVVVMTYPVDRHFFALADACREWGWTFRKELIWSKNVCSFWPGATYQQRHEPILILTHGDTPIGGDVPANATTVFDIPRPQAHDRHATERPMALWSLLVQYHATTSAFDPFVGSGTTIIACEQLERRCFAIEIEPKYVDVCVERWEQYTGGKAKRQRRK